MFAAHLGDFTHMKSLIVPALCGLSLLLSVPAQADATKNCHIGSYRLSGGRAFDIAPSDGDALRLPGGEYLVEFRRGPESRPVKQTLSLDGYRFRGATPFDRRDRFRHARQAAWSHGVGGL